MYDIWQTGAVLVRQSVLAQIQAGEVTLQFRRWRKPTVKAGGRLRTAIGELAIEAVDVVERRSVGDADARAAGYASAAELLAELYAERKATGRSRTARPDESSQLYRVKVSYAGDDDRRQRRESIPGADELRAIIATLARIDARSTRGPWTQRTLELIEQWPARRAPELAEIERRETLEFKSDVRKLKELGLTESLRIGYRLSPRGEVVVTQRRIQPPS